MAAKKLRDAIKGKLDRDGDGDVDFDDFVKRFDGNIRKMFIFGLVVGALAGAWIVGVVVSLTR